MALNPTVMQAVEKLDYRVTVGDVASQAGIDIKLAQQELLALASQAGGHLQVAESGEIAYLFPRNFRAVLRNKFLRLRLQDWWDRVWGILFYLIRISFGILLIASIVLIFLAIAVILISMSGNRDNDNRYGGRSGGMALPRIWIGPDLFWFFSPSYGRYGRYERGYGRRQERRRPIRPKANTEINFLEAVFSFLFGDGDPNVDLEERRWQAIATTIRNNGGAIAAEQVAPYLDTLGQGYDKEYESYMLPVLSRFNGQPEVSPDGEIIYVFPELQVSAAQRSPGSVPAYLREYPWKFSEASSGQITLSAGLGALNFVGALVLGNLLADGTVAAELGGLVAFVQSIYWILLGYGVAFLTVPLVRYFWIQWRNKGLNRRNEQRQERATLLNQADAALQKKIAYAQQFSAATIVSQDDLAYTTETDLLEQEAEHSDKIDAEWQRRLNQSGQS